jgi:hypothetical protein
MASVERPVQRLGSRSGRSPVPADWVKAYRPSTFVRVHEWGQSRGVLADHLLPAVAEPGAGGIVYLVLESGTNRGGYAASDIGPVSDGRRNPWTSAPVNGGGCSEHRFPYGHLSWVC